MLAWFFWGGSLHFVKFCVTFKIENNFLKNKTNFTMPNFMYCKLMCPDHDGIF
jgi:hypothetical protein